MIRFALPRVVLLACCALLWTATQAAPRCHAADTPTQAQDRWAPIRFLLGTWEGTSAGKPGDGTVRREYRLGLRDRFMEARNTVTYPAQEKNPKGEIHDDVGWISYDRARKAYVLRQFHSEGFVNTYLGEVLDDGKRLVFTSETIENIPAGWRARETYRVIGPDAFEETFELAEPKKDFELYSRSQLKRVP